MSQVLNGVNVVTTLSILAKGIEFRTLEEPLFACNDLV